MSSLNDTQPTGVPDEAIQDYVSERCLIGWLLAKPDHWHHVTEEVRPEDFYVPVHSKAISILFAEGHQTCQELAEQVGNIQANVFERWKVDAELDLDTRDVRRRAVRIAKLAMRRKLVGTAERISLEASDHSLGEEEVVQRAKDRLEQIVAPNAPPDNPAQHIDVFLSGINYEYEWVIPNLLERRDRMLVTGTGGTGKSTLLRQIALCTAAGIHPFTGYPMPPMRVLVLDLENSERQVGRKIREPLAAVGPFDSSMLSIVALPKVIDVTTEGGWRWLAGQAEAVKPDLIVGGPVYRMYENGDVSKDMGGKDKAVKVAKALDRLRFRYDCALVMEAHPPKGQDSSLSPFGSAVWEWWPEFGVGLKPEVDEQGNVDVRSVKLMHWRYPRDDRDWPKLLHRNGKYGFSVTW